MRVRRLTGRRGLPGCSGPVVVCCRSATGRWLASWLTDCSLLARYAVRHPDELVVFRLYRLGRRCLPIVADLRVGVEQSTRTASAPRST